MARLLLLSALILAIAYYASAAVARLREELGEVARNVPAPGAERRAGELVACATCGVHVPLPRAFKVFAGHHPQPGSAASRLYCSEDCWHRERSAA